MHVKLCQVFFLLWIGTVGQNALAQEAVTASPDETANIEQAVQSYVAAFNARDAEKLAGHWSPDGVYTSRTSGEQIVGRDAMVEEFKAMFAGEPGHRPPGTRPPGYRPPRSRPPGYRPPGYRPPRPGHLPHYGGGYWGRHPHYHWRWNNYNRNWWGWATAGAVTGWLVADVSAQPVYYDYGTNLYFEGDDVYYNGEAICTADEYAAQAQTIAANVPDVDPENVDWLPLGVFALTESDGSVEDSTLFLQLAISQEGIIAGTFQNTGTDNSLEVEGTSDNESQRAAWGPVGESWPIMETGIYNLTESQADALLHFEDGQTQQWTMIRLDEPKDTGQDTQ